VPARLIEATPAAPFRSTEEIIMDKTSSTAAAKPATTDATKPASIPAATTFSTSGAPVQLSGDIDVSSPAVDNDMRAGTSVLQNKIDFNDPTVSGSDAVATALGMKTEADAGKSPPEDKAKA
jgi:hypothetical protein